MDIKLCEQDNVDRFSEGVDRVLHVLGISKALVTDESRVNDFIPPFKELEALGEARLTALSALMGREVMGKELIWELAKEIS